ncbi:hypothetical protein, variant [Puccinia striiformis f. sp. tritici PST-78]|nr:hypothetical protein, variant [Puccinia striiformis f. sp. tritici PST-78]
MRTRLGNHVDRPLPASCPARANGDATEIRNETPYRLGESLLPELKETLQSLSCSTNSSSSTSLWYNSFLDSLVKIDDLVERIDLSITAVRVAHQSWESHHHGPVIMPFLNPPQIASLMCQVKEFFESGLSQLFVEYDTFFINNSNLSNQSTHILSTVKENEDLERLTTISLEKIDAISQWLRKSMVRLVEEEWSKLVEMIDEEIEWLLKDIYTNYDDQEEEDSWDDEAFIPDQRKDLFRAAIPVMRLSRIYYNKLARQKTNHVRLVFNDPSMHMGMDQLKHLFKETNQILTALYEFLYKIRASDAQEDFLAMVKWLFDSFGESSSILQQHWLALWKSKDPGVNKELIKKALDWLEFWSHQFFLANVKFIFATSNRFWISI